jgi:CheY-like chemotaxis protein
MMSAQSSPSSPRVLVVDDDASVRTLVEHILRRKGFIVTTAGGGIEALDQAQAGSFDLILLDVMMPDLDGKEVCARLKASLATAEIPVVFFSALDDPATRSECLALGAADFLTKPIWPADLVDRVRKHVRLDGVPVLA